MTVSVADLRGRLLPILLAQAVGLGCGIAGVRLISELVTPADYGAYGVFVSLAPVGATVIYAGLVAFISRHWQTSSARQQLLRELAAATRRKTIWLALGCIAITAVVSPARPWVYGSLLFASALLLTWMQLAQSALQSAREHWRDLGISAGASLTRSFLPPLLYAGTGLGLVALLGGFAVHALVGALLGALALRRWWHRPSSAMGTPILTTVYDGPRFIVLAVAAWVLAGLNRWIVASFFGAETAGYFTLAANVGAILPTLIGVVLLQYFQPQWFAASADSKDARVQLLRSIDRVALSYTGVAVLSAAALQAAMPYLIGPLVSERYVGASVFILATGCSAAALMIGNYYHAGLMAAHRERDCTQVDLSGAACLIAGAGISAMGGLDALKIWLTFSPAVPWLVNRTLARRALLGAT